MTGQVGDGHGSSPEFPVQGDRATLREATDVVDAWAGDPLFYPAKPPAHWLMVAEVAGRVLLVPLAPARSGDPSRCRPIGCYEAAPGLAAQYRRDR